MGMASQSTSRGLGEAGSMNATIWGGLQSHINLMMMIYAKLPIGDFFRLRQVCKDWDRLASDQAFLLGNWRDPISSPYFIVDSQKIGHPRLLTYKASSWSWTRLPPMKCEAGGMLLCEDSNRVFNVHTRVFHSLPPLEEGEEDGQPLIGLIVDSLSSFQVILGDQNIGTRIYDSNRNLWMHKSSRHEFSTIGQSIDDDKVMPKPTSVYYNDLLYIRVWAADQMNVDLHYYNVERDEWWVVELRSPEEAWVFCDVGVWRNRLYMFRIEVEPSGGISAWETCGKPEFERNWTLYDRMPEDLCAWMFADVYDSEAIEMQGKFCGEYVLVYSCVGIEEVTERAVLYNLNQKTWEKVELPD